MKHLIIDRSKWRTGGAIYDKRFGNTELLNDRGMMCCLGFYCLQIGNKSPNEISERALPESLNSDKGIEELVVLLDLSDYITLKNNAFTEAAININDNPNLPNEFRETEIHQHFKTINVDVKFINEYPS